MEIKDRKENTQLKIIRLLLRKVFNKKTLKVIKVKSKFPLETKF